MTDPHPLVSVIVPAYNAAEYIDRSIESVLEQTYTNLEVLVVDDGSTDDTRDVVEGFCKRDPRVRLLVQENAGVAAARNLAIANSNGVFIAPIDADDVWFSEKIERQVEKMLEGGEEVGLVYTWWVGIDRKGVAKGLAARWQANGRLEDALLFVNFIGNASVPLFRKSSLDQVGGYSAHFRAANGQGCEDWDITLRVAERYKTMVVPAYLMGYRKIEGSMSDNWTSMAKSYDMMIDDLIARRPDVDPKVLAWSRSHFSRYIAAKAYMADQYVETMQWLWKSAVQDPCVLLPVGLWKMSSKTVVKWILWPITSQIWPDKASWLAFRERTRIRLRKPKQRTLQEMIERAEGRTPTWAWRPWKPYDVVMRSRWARLSNYGSGSASPSTKRKD